MLLEEPRSTLIPGEPGELHFSPDGERLLFGASFSREPYRCVHLASGEVAELWLGQNTGLAFSPDGSRLCITRIDGYQLFNLQGLLVKDVWQKPARGQAWNLPAYSPGGELIALALRVPRNAPPGPLPLVALLDPVTLQTVKELRHGERPAAPPLNSNSFQLSFGPGGQELTWLAGPGTWRQSASWNLATEEETAFVQVSSRSSLALASTGQELVEVRKRSLAFWRREPLRPWKLESTRPLPPGAFATNGRSVLTLGDNPVVDAEVGATCTLRVQDPSFTQPIKMLLEGQAIAMAVNPASSLAAVLTLKVTTSLLGWSPFLWLWGLTSGRPLVQVPCRYGSPARYEATLQFSPDGRWLVAQGRRGLELWDVAQLLG